MWFNLVPNLRTLKIFFKMRWFDPKFNALWTKTDQVQTIFKVHCHKRRYNVKLLTIPKILYFAIPSFFCHIKNMKRRALNFWYNFNNFSFINLSINCEKILLYSYFLNNFCAPLFSQKSLLDLSLICTTSAFIQFQLY